MDEQSTAIQGQAMSKPRVTTDEQCKELADWWWDLKNMGTVRDKARELGISIPALYDSIKRGLGEPTRAQKYKVREYAASESIQSESKEDAA
jgi:hypothetical protein